MPSAKNLWLWTLLFFPAAQAVAQTDTEVAITHDAISCWPNDDYVVIEANLAPATQVETARVYFRAMEFVDFYFVEMTRSDQGKFEAVMPRPSPETEQVVYYIEAVDRAFNSVQTEEQAPRVSPLDGCSSRRFIGVPAIVIGSMVANVAAVPAGFQAIGIAGFTGAAAAAGAVTGGAAAAAEGAVSGTAAASEGAGGGAATSAGAGAGAGTAGGLSTAAVVGIAGGAAAVVGVAVAAGGGDDGASSSFGGGSTGTGGPMSGTSGTGTAPDPTAVDNDGDGFSEQAGDCDDANAMVHPNGAINFSDARFQPDSVVCPEGSTDFEFRVSIRFAGSNQSCTAVTIDSVDVSVTVTRAQGDVANFVGQSEDFNGRSANPARLEIGESRDGIVVNLPYDCVNVGGQPGFFENDAVMKIHTSAGTFDLTASNVFRLEFPLTAPTSLRQPSTPEPEVDWSSELRVPDGEGQVRLNGAPAFGLGSGQVSRTSERILPGKNLVEAQLVSASGQPGPWRFDFAEGGAFERGSILLKIGSIEALTETSIVFRLSGRAGERISFSFRGRPRGGVDDFS